MARAEWAGYLAVGAVAIGLCAPPAAADAACPVSHADLTAALKKSVRPSGGPSNGGLDNNEWAAVVNREGIVCAIAFSGGKVDDQWPASRAIAAEKANTANAMSLSTFAIATANLYAGAQPGGYLYGVALTNPPNAPALIAGPPAAFGTENDPLLGNPSGGVVVFGGGLALYDGKDIVGGIGLSGDTACADHNIAWRVRKELKLDKVPAGPAATHKDAILYDIGPDGKSASGFGHPTCGHEEQTIADEIGAGAGTSK